MSKIITAIYEKGVLRPLSPLLLQENQTVLLQVLTKKPPLDEKDALELLVALGIVTPHPHRDDVEPVSEEARRELAERLGKCPGKPLSEIIIEERGSA